jgi:soluble lytic murein transglycosylase-like protein
MRTTIATAAAFAAGLTAFAASAEPRQSASPRASEATYSPAKPLAAAALPKIGSRTRISQRDDADTTIRSTRVAKEQPKAQPKAPPEKRLAAAKTSTPKAVKRKKGRERIDLDTVTTAAIAPTTPQAIAASGAYGEIISRYASAYGVPVQLAHAVIRIESNYRPNIRGSAGEIGLMQIKPSTARMMGYSGGTSGLYNPETNIKYGMKYLGMAQELGGGTTCGTILKYNAGHGARRMNPVSSAYCSKVKKHLNQ